ncbi:SDR family NAD(P)-dependent oxidoreductase [Neptuniibacter sp.]|uniref:SDR family NAD(P)-dependent oxidoreductase n=1 Tax=Neptuniibacter sp. TaxID=1962643 RepID=UPI0026165549|nr:SDR family NAD(P)-dependent oxidoreductase [Neptuniibacter sp.]MCP4595995.1 SDR family oxidoreductase [Neptuniibacter sp.]
MSKLDRKIAIVTGAGQGIGKGIALALAKEGADVVVAGRTVKKCVTTSNEIKTYGARALPIVCDVGQRRQVEALVAATVEEFGTVDILVNNAQATKPQVTFEETTDEDMTLAIQSGLMGTFHCMQICLPYLKNRGGKIINVASAAGTEGRAGFASYAAAKEGIRALTRVAAHEWGKYHINVNVICPLANSPSFQQWATAFPDEFQGFLAEVPMGYLGECEKDIGRVVAFLASSDSDYITGHTIMVDGGESVLR